MRLNRDLKPTVSAASKNSYVVLVDDDELLLGESNTTMEHPRKKNEVFLPGNIQGNIAKWWISSSYVLTPECHGFLMSDL